MNQQRLRRSDRLLRLLYKYDDIVVVAHDNPDPDAMASGWAIMRLVEARLGKRARLLGGGEIVRAENRHMVKLLEVPIELVQEIDVQDKSAIVLVDCGASATNHLMAHKRLRPVAVVDHHWLTRDEDHIPLRDVRPGVTACASITTSYLREQEVEIDSELATALLYAIQTETRGCETHYSRLDRTAVLWLAKRADLSQIAEIENAPLSRKYFESLVLALQNTFVYGEAAFCLLPLAKNPEIVGEVADLLIRYDRVKRVLCAAVFRGDLLVSVRTERGGDDATGLLRQTLDGLGRGGGHQHRAGGKVAKITRGQRVPEDLEETLRARWLAACGQRRRRGTRLIPPREILHNL